MISEVSNWSYTRLEQALLPVQGNMFKKTACYSLQFFSFCLFMPMAMSSSTLSFMLSRFSSKVEDLPLIAFSKMPVWGPPMKAAPISIGFASAEFQDNGPDAHPDTNWGKFYKERFGPIKKVPDTAKNPHRVIKRLKALGVRKYRFSISRDRVEPKAGLGFDRDAIKHYRTFCKSLKSHGIEPMVTLHHFTDPSYFSWDRKEDIDGFVKYSKKMATALYKEGVRKVITINEPSVLALQGWVMGEFPPHHKLDFEGAGRVLENMMIAHTRVYEAIKAEHPDMEVGLSHDPLRFHPYHARHPLWSPLEKILCHYLTEISHGVLMRFLQTGKFAMKIPFRANYSFEFSKPPPMDFIGLQYYTDPLIKLSFRNAGSVSHDPLERLSSFGYRMYPQGLASALEEMRSLNIPIELTEIGIDTGVNAPDCEKTRIEYFDRIFQVVQKALDHGVPVRSLHFWTLIRNLEWARGYTIDQGFYDFNPETGKIKARLVAKWLKKRISSIGS